MDNVERIAAVIRNALDPTGLEITWHEARIAASAVVDELEDVFVAAWQYEDLANS